MTAILTNPKERGRFLRFVVVGGIGMVVDFSIANLLVHVFSAPLVVAGTISFICAILSNFIWNRYWTYPDSRSKHILQQLVQFFIVSIAGLLIRVPILYFLEPILEELFLSLPFEFPILGPEVLADNITLAVAILVVMFWNFFVNRYWTYSDVK